MASSLYTNTKPFQTSIAMANFFLFKGDIFLGGPKIKDFFEKKE